MNTVHEQTFKLLKTKYEEDENVINFFRLYEKPI